MAKKRGYHIRYAVEEWNKPAATRSRQVRPGIRVTASKYGYTDDLFIASILRNEDDSVGSVLLLDSGSETEIPRKEVLELVRDQINHYLEEHHG